MRSSKSRSRSKSNRQRTLGNVVNRVFDSSGPEGKVRGTPQQIIEKYLTLARDAQLSHDRVAEQSFLQHAEHYTRMLGEANREMADRQGQGDDNSYQSSIGGHGYHQPNQNGGAQNGGGQNGGGQGNQSNDGNQRRDGGQRDGGRDQQSRDYQGRDNQGRDYQNRDNQNRDGQNRDGQNRDNQGRDNQGRDNQNRDGQNRDGQNRDGQSRDHQSRDSQPRDNQSRDNQPRDGQQQREPRAPRAESRNERQDDTRVEAFDTPQPALPDFLTQDGLSQPVHTPESDAEAKPVRKRTPRQPRPAAVTGDEAAAPPVTRSRRKPAPVVDSVPESPAPRDGTDD